MAHILPHLITKNWWSFGGDDGALHHHLPSSFFSSVMTEASQFSIRSIFSIFIISFLMISYSTNKSRRKKKNYKIPPYVPGSILDHIRMTTNSQYPWWIINVATQLNTHIFQFKIPIAPLSYKFAIGEVHTFREILQDPLSERPLFIFKAVRRVYGAQGGVGTPTVLTSNGSVWHSKRKAIATAFSSKHVKRMNKLAVEMTDCWIHERLQTSSNNNAISEPFDVAEEIVNVVLSAICETGFEYKISSDEKEQLGLDLQSALTEFVTRESLNKWRAYTGLLLPERRRAIHAAQRFNALMLKIMAQYRMLDKPTPGTIINAVMESDAFPTDDEKAAQLAEFLVGGHDTTAYSISWILLELARNPLEQKALREELVNLSPEEWNTSEKLKMVIKEGMRLHPVVAAGSVRRTGRDIITQRNELIPKGSICFCPFFLLFRNPDIFPNPNKFIPTRWENPTRDMRDAFNPFSMGKQNCAGQALARVETQAIVARICSQFELRVEDEGDVDFFLTLKPVGARLRAIKV